MEESVKENSNFDPCLMNPEIFIKSKIQYMTEVIKQSCYMRKKVIAIVDLNYSAYIEDEWLNVLKKPEPL